VTQTQATSKGRKAAPPITAHRLFPLAVGLWCAALLGLGSFAVHPALLARIVAATGLPALVPAAAPPLGMTARVLLALLLAMAGGIAGLAVGLALRPRREAPARRRMNPVREAAESPSWPRGRDSHPDAPVCTPLVLGDDLIDEGLAPVVERTPEFEAEVEAETEAPAPFFATEIAEFEDIAPEPAPEAVVVDAPAEPAPHPAAPRFAIPEAIVPGAPRSPVAESPLDSLGLVQMIERLALAIAERRAVRATLAEAPAEQPESVQPEAALPETMPVEAVTPAEPEPEPAPEPAPACFAPEPVAEAPAAPVVAIAEPAPTPAPIPRFASPQAADASLVSRSPLFRQALAHAVPAVPADELPMILAEGEDLPIVDLGDPALAGPAPEGIIPSPYSPLVPKQPQRVVPLRPGAFHPIDPIDDTDDEDERDYAVPRFLGRAALDDVAEEAQPDTGTDEPVAQDIVPEERYSSLVGMTAPQPRPEPRQEFIRIDEPELEEGHEPEPVVVFPGQAPFARPVPADAQGGAQPQVFVPQSATAADPQEADRALRAALATLQRMTAKG
jgi:hypothetical protein